MSSKPECLLFAGPTLYRAGGSRLAVPAGVRVLPPVQRGDIPRLLQTEPPGVLVIADGLFHQVLAVGHVELRDALAAGWQVWGLSSMGAIRAFEMRLLGMRGYGRVYDRFLREPDFQDDEVALLHAPEPPYTAFTEPLVHLRVALDHFREAGLLPLADSDAVAADFKALWYGERSLSVFQARVLARAAPCHQDRVREELGDFDRFRIKTHDLAEFLRRHGWEG